MTNRVCITDLVYALHLNVNNVNTEIIKQLYLKDPNEFNRYLKQHFCIDYQNKVFTKIEAPLLNLPYSQVQIDECFAKWSNFFHKHINPKFLKDRGITDNQIEKYNLGSTHIFGLNKETKKFLKDLSNDFPVELLEDVLWFHSNNKETNFNLYNAPYFSTIPSNGSSCSGIVYRSEGWYKLDTMRNLYKFFVSHAPTYCFNSEALQYDKIIIVEGVFDVLALDRLGIKNSLCFSSTRVSEYQYQLIKDKKCLFIFDGDLGGQAGLDYVKETYNNPDFEYKQLSSEKDFDELKDKEVFKVLENFHI